MEHTAFQSPQMENSILIRDYPLQLNEITTDAGIRSYVLFNILQDAAGRHADLLGVGLRQLRQNNLIWVLSRIRFKMEAFPEYGDSIRITTYPSGFDRLFAYRQFRIDSAETGKHFGTAGSAWLTLNPETLRPFPPERLLQGNPLWNPDMPRYFQQDLGKIRPFEDQELQNPLPHRISATEIDYNNHLNNAYYGMLAEDWLGEKTGSLVRVWDIQVNFNFSGLFRDTLICSGTITGDQRFYVEGSLASNGKNAFQATGSFEIINNSVNQ